MREWVALVFILLVSSGCFRFHTDSIFSYCKELYKVEISEEELKKSLLDASSSDTRIDFKNEANSTNKKSSSREEE